MDDSKTTQEAEVVPAPVEETVAAPETTPAEAVAPEAVEAKEPEGA